MPLVSPGTAREDGGGMIESSKEIIERAIAEYSPYAIVSMVSGGKDSLCAYLVAKELATPITHILHGVTGTGIPETTDFVRSWVAQEAAGQMRLFRPMCVDCNDDEVTP